MDVEVVMCECCGLKEECTLDYINGVKSKFNGKWLCGLCSEAVRDELSMSSAGKKQSSVEDAVKSHASFCRKSKSSPAFRVADGMRQMLRRRSTAAAPSPPSMLKYARSSGRASLDHQLNDDSSFSRIY